MRLQWTLEVKKCAEMFYRLYNTTFINTRLLETTQSRAHKNVLA